MTFPGIPLVGPWDTRDRWIPWRLFWLLVGQMDGALALQRVNQMQATAKAIGLAFGGSNGKVQAVVAQDIKLAAGGGGGGR